MNAVWCDNNTGVGIAPTMVAWLEPDGKQGVAIIDRTPTTYALRSTGPDDKWLVATNDYAVMPTGGSLKGELGETICWRRQKLQADLTLLEELGQPDLAKWKDSLRCGFRSYGSRRRHAPREWPDRSHERPSSRD